MSEFLSTLLEISTEKHTKHQPTMVDTVFVKHQNYLSLPDTSSLNTTYINLIRDPVKRFISAYYFKRFVFNKYLRQMETLSPPFYLQLSLPFYYLVVQKSWLEDTSGTSLALSVVSFISILIGKALIN